MRPQAVPRSFLPRSTLVWETVLVLGVSLGASALWSLLSIARKLTRPEPLSAQTTAMNTSAVPGVPWLDLVHQLVGIGLALVPVLLALHLLDRDLRFGGPARSPGPTAYRLLGADLTRPTRDLAAGITLAALIGLPGLALYLLARELGLNTTIAAEALPDVWWAVPVLVLAALQNAVLEEVVMVGYLFTRWAQAGWSAVAVVLTSALLRGTYHLYQGFGGFVGNVAMGLLLGWVYLRTGRILPLVIAHALLDIVAFVGYAVMAPRVGWL